MREGLMVVHPHLSMHSNNSFSVVPKKEKKCFFSNEGFMREKVQAGIGMDMHARRGR